MVEQRTENPCVGGSIPPPATTLNCSSSKELSGWRVLVDTNTDTNFGTPKQTGVTGANTPATP
ncbi:hypothetical protein SBV1_130093 [Verrucomicrobia bacterium]|nr:hypothetical protein SBV1_130093 [Verrucomicrobiota bacterium]